jgi:hypothetical protein
VGWRVCGLRYTAALSLSPKGRYVTALRLGDLGRVRRTPSGLSRPPRGLREVGLAPLDVTFALASITRGIVGKAAVVRRCQSGHHRRPDRA